MVRDTVRAFVRERVLPSIAEWFEEGVFPREFPKELGKLGLLGMHLDGYGCVGASATSYGLACLELEAGDSGVRSFTSVQGSLAMFANTRCGHATAGFSSSMRKLAGSAHLAPCH